MNSRPPAISKLDRPDDASCPSAIELAAWCDGSLADERSGAVALHVAGCARCSDSVAASTVDAGAPDASGADAGSIARLVEHAEALRPIPAPIPFARFVRISIAAAASIAAMIGGWHAATLLVDAAAPATTIAAPPATIAANTTDDAEALATGDATVLADEQSSEDDLTSLLTFGLLDERDDSALFEFETNDGTHSRSDS